MRLGIDFGTTNSAVAFFDGQTLQTAQLEPDTDSPEILPSLIYIDRDHDYFLGTQAMNTYVERETGRGVRWKRHYIGEFEVTVAGTGSGPIVFMQDAYAWSDEAALGRLVQSVKTALRDTTYQGTRIFDRYYSLDEMLYRLLLALRERAEAYLGAPCEEVVIGRPVRFTHDAESDRRAEEILYKSALWAGFKQIHFRSEPIGATYLHHVESKERQRILVFDFGGGTLDFTIADVGGSEAPNILATHGVLVGGDDLDRAIMKSLLKYFGANAKIGREVFPYEMLDKLLYWQTQPEISRPEYRDVLHDFRTHSTDKRAIENLDTLVHKKLGFGLFKEIERVKIELSTEWVSCLEFSHDKIRIREHITRQQFERMITDQLQAVDEGLQAVLDKAGISEDNIDLVARTGGSSQIPAFVKILTDRFGHEKIRAMHPLASIVGGLGIVAHEQRGIHPVYTERYVMEDDIHTIVEDVQGLSADYQAYLLQLGEAPYTDIETTFKKIPVELSRLPAIRVVQRDYESTEDQFLQFTLKKPAKVYVAYIASATQLPQWLRDFQQVPHEIDTDDPWFGVKRYFLYYKRFEAGTVSLGANRAEGYAGRVNLQYFPIIQVDC